MLTVAGLLVAGVGAVGLLALAGATLWLRPGLLRGVGLMLIWFQLSRLAVAMMYPWVFVPAVRWLLIGIVLWLLGHWLYGARWHTWHSATAARVFALPVLRSIAPWSGPGHA